MYRVKIMIALKLIFRVIESHYVGPTTISFQLPQNQN